MPNFIPLEDRIMMSIVVNPETGCWLWEKYVSPLGYARIGITRGGRKQAFAHRVSYETFVGPIPAGLEIDHLCRVRSCVNPKHLEPVTHQVNGQRGNAGKHYDPLRGQFWRNKTHCKHGHPLSGDNISIRKDKYQRICLACARLSNRAKKLRAKQQREAARVNTL